MAPKQKKGDRQAPRQRWMDWEFCGNGMFHRTCGCIGFADSQLSTEEVMAIVLQKFSTMTVQQIKAELEKLIDNGAVAYLQSILELNEQQEHWFDLNDNVYVLCGNEEYGSAPLGFVLLNRLASRSGWSTSPPTKDESAALTDLLLDHCQHLAEHRFSEYKDSRGSPIIADAIHHKNYPMLEVLIQRGVDLNQECALGQTPLFLAMYCRDAKAFKMLLDGGADINKTKQEYCFVAECSKPITVQEKAERDNQVEFVNLVNLCKKRSSPVQQQAAEETSAAAPEAVGTKRTRREPRQ